MSKSNEQRLDRQVREEELVELDELARDVCLHDAKTLDAKGGAENSHGKTAILLQVWPLLDERMND